MTMKRVIGILCSIVLCAAGSQTLCRHVHAQPSDPYIVQYGDTLWDIAGDQLQNPHRWREIHQHNPQIVNPNLIYPGDILGMVPGTGGQTGTAPAGRRRSDKAIARPWYGLPAPLPEEVTTPQGPRPLVPSADFIEATGYIVPYTMQDLTTGDFAQITAADAAQGGTTHVIQSEYGQIGLVFGDIIYLNKGASHNVKEGDVYVAFRPRQEVYHPISGEFMGTQIDILGRIRVKTLEPAIACAEIIKSYNYIELGDPIMPASELSLPLEKPAIGNSRSYGLQVGNQLIGHIIVDKTNHPGISYGDIVYIDVGAAQGVQPADNFIIFREVGEGFPRQGIGRLTVLSVQEQTSTAMITESVKTIVPGEKIALRR